MTSLMGKWTYDIKLVSKEGLRRYTDVTVICELSPEQINEYKFSLVITTDVLDKWKIEENKLKSGLLPLIEEMYDGSINLKIVPPENGYWFDGDNTADDIHETVNLMRNGQRVWFLQNPAEEDHFAEISGGAIMTELEHLDQTFVSKTGQHLLHKPDQGYVRSQIVRDLSTDPKDDRELLGKVASLSVIIDCFGVKMPSTKLEGSLERLNEWLKDRVGEDRQKELTGTFYHIRGLRNQYPLHFRFDKTTGAAAHVERSRVQDAAEYFGFRAIDGDTDKWIKICNKVRATIAELENYLAS